MPIFIIEIPGSEFTGVKCGMDFYKGRGTTGSGADAAALAKHGYKVSELGTATTKTEGGAQASSPVDLSPTPGEREAAEKQAQERAELDAVERNPDSEWSKKRKAAAKEKAKPRRRRK